MLDSFLLTERTVHLCIDMQELFSAQGTWPTPWMERVLPRITEIAGRFPARTVFTRFIPPNRPEDMPGRWQKYYCRGERATLCQIDRELLELMPSLAKYVPPATVINKTRFSAFVEPQLLTHLHERQADGLVVTGSETDVCVLATALSAVDLGYPVIVVDDAICSSSDEGHDALMKIYHGRYSEQIKTLDTEALLRRWSR